jgi:uncharacterized OsmC-like protein
MTSMPMDAGPADLRAVQEPLKVRYRAEPEAALITLEAQGRLDETSVSCRVEMGSQLAAAGLHPATGGDGTLLCSGDMLLQALVACAGVTLLAVAANRGLQVSGTVRAEGDLDFRGTLAVDRDAPVGFQSVRLHFALESEASEGDLDEVLKATERYCVVYQTLKRGTEVATTRS